MWKSFGLSIDPWLISPGFEPSDTICELDTLHGIRNSGGYSIHPRLVPRGFWPSDTSCKLITLDWIWKLGLLSIVLWPISHWLKLSDTLTWALGPSDPPCDRNILTRVGASSHVRVSSNVLMALEGKEPNYFIPSLYGKVQILLERDNAIFFDLIIDWAVIYT